MLTSPSASRNDMVASAPAAPMAPAPTESVSSYDVYQTNTQVQGVDEADIVKTDGKYIYTLINNVNISIVSCENPENMTEVGIISLTDYNDYNYIPAEMYLYEDTLVLMLSEKSSYQPVTFNNSNGVLCDCVCYAAKKDTVVKIFDISDKANPNEIFTYKISGDYVSSRLTDGRLITVSQFRIPYDSVYADDFNGACEGVKEVSIPEYSVNNADMQKIPVDRIKVFDEENPTNYTVTSILNLDDTAAEPAVNAFLGGADEIYCTREEVFVAENIYTTWTYDEELVVTDTLGNKHEIATRIHKMKIDDSGVEYVASVTVGGSFINQFSMDKSGDYFRIATNGVDWKSKKRQTMVWVVDKDMNISVVGDIDFEY